MSLRSAEQIIIWAAALTGEEWRKVATTISWLHRRYTDLDGAPAGKIPAELRAVREIVLDPEAWASIRKKVASLRRSKHRREVKEKAETAAQRRRAYMRRYMAVYRARSVAAK
mgnify:CR=1 FL=1